MKSTVIAGFCVFFVPSFSLATIDHFDSAPSAEGLTGGIHLPGAGTVAPLDLAFGVHGSEPKANFGLPLPGLEAGVATLFRSTGEFRDLVADGKASVKFKAPIELLFRRHASALALAAGFEESGLKPHFFALGSLVAPRLPFWKTLALEITFGGGSGRFEPAFGAVWARFHKQAALLFEEEGSRSHAGARILLSQRLRLDFFLLDLARPLGASPVKEVFRERIRIGVSTTAAPWRKRRD